MAEGKKDGTQNEVLEIPISGSETMANRGYEFNSVTATQLAAITGIPVEEIEANPARFRVEFQHSAPMFTKDELIAKDRSNNDMVYRARINSDSHEELKFWQD